MQPDPTSGLIQLIWGLNPLKVILAIVHQDTSLSLSRQPFIGNPFYRHLSKNFTSTSVKKIYEGKRLTLLIPFTYQTTTRTSLISLN